VPYWKPLVVDGFAVDLSHLEPFEFEGDPKRIGGFLGSQCSPGGFRLKEGNRGRGALTLPPASRTNSGAMTGVARALKYQARRSAGLSSWPVTPATRKRPPIVGGLVVLVS
jgi:hypothetical protein